jgi:hypothetical protein
MKTILTELLYEIREDRIKHPIKCELPTNAKCDMCGFGLHSDLLTAQKELEVLLSLHPCNRQSLTMIF